MRYYIVDDNLATVKSLESIIKLRELGTVCGYATDPVSAIDEILEEAPDIVLVDLLMGGMDGITLVERVRRKTEGISFVMISKVSDKEMVQRAYTAGIEFFINKPVNIIEVEQVLRNVAEKVQMRGIMGSIRSMVDLPKAVEINARPPREHDPSRGLPESEQTQEHPQHSIDLLLGTLGMLGEKGTADIRAVFGEMLRRGSGYDRAILEAAAQQSGDTVKNVEQRIRRAVKKGLTNAATMALEDFDNEAVRVYGGYVFDFRTIREEMNSLKTGTGSGGRVNIAGFFEGLLLYYHAS